jgi:Peptidase family M28
MKTRPVVAVLSVPLLVASGAVLGEHAPRDERRLLAAAGAVEVELAARFHDDAPDGVNVVAEIPGGKKKDEVVMLGAHLDSWHAGTGATDNAAGCAVVLEAFRILDVYDHVQSGDLMQASAVLASFVYGAAVRPDKLPRKPLPRPLPARKADRAASAGG